MLRLARHFDVYKVICTFSMLCSKKFEIYDDSCCRVCLQKNSTSGSLVGARHKSMPLLAPIPSMASKYVLAAGCTSFSAVIDEELFSPRFAYVSSIHGIASATQWDPGRSFQFFYLLAAACKPWPQRMFQRRRLPLYSRARWTSINYAPSSPHSFILDEIIAFAHYGRSYLSGTLVPLLKASECSSSESSISDISWEFLLWCSTRRVESCSQKTSHFFTDQHRAEPHLCVSTDLILDPANNSPGLAISTAARLQLRISVIFRDDVSASYSIA